jgi:hypothetical protein
MRESSKKEGSNRDPSSGAEFADWPKTVLYSLKDVSPFILVIEFLSQAGSTSSH